MTINAIIIDDEKHCTELLQWEIQNHCPEIQVIGVTNSATQGLELIKRQKPDVVFLDIEMPVMNGFELLKKFNEIPFEVIFTTAYDQFAIKAIRFSALDYLLKPIHKAELVKAIQKLIKKKSSQKEHQVQMEFLLEQLSSKGKGPSKMVIPCLDGLEIVELKRILYCKASSNYTEFHFEDQHKKIVSKTLKQIEELLSESNFLRVHQSYLVNLDRVIKYVKSGGGYLILDNNSTVNVAQSKKQTLVKKLYSM